MFPIHSDELVSSNGERISKNCNLCHSITAQDPVNEIEFSSFNETLDFKHPEDIDE